jgi:hypothetical protein
MKKFLFFIITAAALAFAGCKSDDDPVLDPVIDPSLSVSPASISATIAAGTYSIAVTSNVTWTVEVNAGATWCTVSPVTGTADGSVTVSVAENAVVETRAATVTISAGTLTQQVIVTQSAAAPVLDVDITTIDATVAAATYSIVVTSNVTWTVEVNAGATWCTVLPATGTADGSVTVSVTENVVVETRAATVTVSAGTLTQQVGVTQAAAAPVLDVDRTTIDATLAAATYSIAVTSNVTWAVEVNAGATWCTVSPATGTANGSVTVSVTENAVVETRAATVTISAGTLTQQVGVTQTGIPTPTYAASTHAWTFGDQTWSDAIHIPACNIATFARSTTTPYCRSYTENGNTWYYYNWAYVNTNAATLCESPWRVPSQSDFNTLVSNTDYTTLVDEWGYGGLAQNNTISTPNMYAYYWSSTVHSSPASTAYYLYYYSYFGSLTVLADAMFLGYQVRCVK